MIPFEVEVLKGGERQDVVRALPSTDGRLARYPLKAEPRSWYHGATEQAQGSYDLCQE